MKNSIHAIYVRIKGINESEAMSTNIHLFNTKTRSIELFRPIIEGKVGIYSCGPTVYHYQHLGNMRAAVFADTVRRIFVSAGYVVRHITNITDVGHLAGDGDMGEDKLERGSRREGKTVWEIAKMYADAYFSDLATLNIPLEMYTFPRATDHIQEQIGLIAALEIAGHTYTISDGVYFETATFPTYADFAQLDIEGLKSGARVEENKEKRNITDFALWKFSPKDTKREMEWDSPWGKGFPGWHIECSAMSMKYLGTHFDIHTGGIDHIPVHHTNEIAQSESMTGETYVNYWMHVNFLNDDLGKMSKSNDEFLTLTSLIEKGYDPLAYRYYLLTSHYRKEMMFSYEALDGAAVAYKKLVDWSKEHTKKGAVDSTYLEKFTISLYDDIGTSSAVAEMWNLLRDDNVNEEDKYATILVMSDILGLGLEKAIKVEIVIPEEVQMLLNERKSAREEKDFTESDRLRDEILRLGFTVKDTSHGQEVTTIEGRVQNP